MTQWIDVKDRLPEPFVSVLVYIPELKPFPTVHESFNIGKGTWTFGPNGSMGVTHWAEMPEPPGGKEL